MSRLQGKAAFTLLEVMIALAILSLVGVAFLRAQAASVRLLDESSQISLATLLGREKMAELETLGFPPLGKTSGAGGEKYPHFRWETAVSATDAQNLRKGQVRVLWGGESQERSLELICYFANHGVQSGLQGLSSGDQNLQNLGLKK